MFALQAVQAALALYGGGGFDAALDFLVRQAAREEVNRRRVCGVTATSRRNIKTHNPHVHHLRAVRACFDVWCRRPSKPPADAANPPCAHSAISLRCRCARKRRLPKFPRRQVRQQLPGASVARKTAVAAAPPKVGSLGPVHFTSRR